jgi:hypothetical protein
MDYLVRPCLIKKIYIYAFKRKPETINKESNTKRTGREDPVLRFRRVS